MVKALLLKTTGEVLPLELEKDNEYPTIRDAVGGYIDTVTHKDVDDLVGYVHDEGLLIGLPANVMASIMFSRPLVGDVVLVGGLNAKGYYDGESYDVPEKYLAPEFASVSAHLALSEIMTEIIKEEAEKALNSSPTVVSLSSDEMYSWLTTGEIPSGEPTDD